MEKKIKVTELLYNLDTENVTIDVKVNDTMGSDWLLNLNEDFVNDNFGMYEVERHKFTIDHLDRNRIRLIIHCTEVY